MRYEQLLHYKAVERTEQLHPRGSLLSTATYVSMPAQTRHILSYQTSIAEFASKQSIATMLDYSRVPVSRQTKPSTVCEMILKPPLPFANTTRRRES
jgi:hypothetical protein